MIAAAIVFGTPAAAQNVESDDTGIPTETQRRLAQDKDDNTIWNLLGLIGLFGLIGYSRPSDNDGYTDDPI